MFTHNELTQYDQDEWYTNLLHCKHINKVQFYDLTENTPLHNISNMALGIAHVDVVLYQNLTVAYTIHSSSMLE